MKENEEEKKNQKENKTSVLNKMTELFDSSVTSNACRKKFLFFRFPL